MSDLPNNHNEQTDGKEPSERRLLFSVIGWLALIFLFLGILVVIYVPNRPPRADQPAVERRLRALEKVQLEQRRKAESYEVLDREAGIIRIPIDVARTLMAERLSQVESPNGAADATTSQGAGLP